jgi:putative tryptophan/tyrosine transport system substrate-binding protein
MRRRDFITLIGGAATGWPIAARGQQAEQMRRIGVLMSVAADDPRWKALLAAGLRDGLARLGWIEGSTIHIDYRFAGGDPDQFSVLAKELVALHPEVIFAQSTPVTAALQRETRAIAIVFVEVSDPIGSGFIASLAHPGGNVTGIIQYEPGIAGKWLAMLKEIAPNLARVALLANPKGTAYEYFLRNATAAASSLGIEIISSPVDNVADIERSIGSLARQDNGGLLCPPETFITAHRDLVIALAAKYRLPAVYPWRQFVTDDGGLMSYGIDLVDVYQQSASYIDRILRGANPADLPVQSPTRYETALNLKTAKALGFSVPASLLVRADEVIE